VIDGVSFEITLLSDRVAAHLARDRRYQAILVIPGIGPILAAIFVVEIGDITRFRTPAQPVFLGRADPAALRVRHQIPQRPDHQPGFPAAAVGRGRGHPTRPERIPHAPPDGRHHRPPRQHRPATSPRSPQPANCSPSSSTGYATEKSVA
jgi:hypothetical protein